MTNRRKTSGQFELPITATEAIDYFTPEGERSWALGWDPTYPAGEPTETPGTVFITRHGGTETVWVIQKVDRTANTSAYSRLTSGHHAGTVRVECDDRANDQCIVSVEYDMTTLTPDHPQGLDAYGEESFKAMMKEWETRVTTNLPPK